MQVTDSKQCNKSLEIQLSDRSGNDNIEPRRRVQFKAGRLRHFVAIGITGIKCPNP